MPSRVQRLGGGPSVRPVTCRASAPGPWCSRSWSSSRGSLAELKMAAAVAAVLVGEQAGQALGLKAVEPGVEGVGVARAEQAMAGDGVGRQAVGDLEQGGAAFAHIGAGVVVTEVAQLLKLLLGKGEGAALWHRGFLLVMFRYSHFTEFGRQNSLGRRGPGPRSPDGVRRHRPGRRRQSARRPSAPG